MDDITEEINKLKKEINNLKKMNDKQEKLINSHQTILDILFQDFDLKPKGVLNYSQRLCIELLDFVDNVCKKHDLEWWLDYGNLLGAVRHKGFIPWDDDVDVGMMRKDCLKFRDIIADEVKLHNLDDILKVSHQRKIRDDYVVAFTQVMVFYKGLYAGIDIFGKDFCRMPVENESFLEIKSLLHTSIIEGMDKKEAINQIYEKYDFSFERQDYFIPCMEGGWGKYVQFKLYDSNKVFPLKQIQFEEKLYPCPNDCDYYLKNRYGKDYNEIPKKIIKHKRVSKLKQKENVLRNFEIFIKRLKEVNENFIC